MLPCGVVLVLRGFQIMTECDPGMMRGLLMIAGFVMLGGLAMTVNHEGEVGRLERATALSSPAEARPARTQP